MRNPYVTDTARLKADLAHHVATEGLELLAPCAQIEEHGQTWKCILVLHDLPDDGEAHWHYLDFVEQTFPGDQVPIWFKNATALHKSIIDRSSMYREGKANKHILTYEMHKYLKGWLAMWEEYDRTGYKPWLDPTKVKKRFSRSFELKHGLAKPEIRI